MTEIVRKMPWSCAKTNPEALLTREWLISNGLGGYASGTVSGVRTRRYHGMLVAALPAPLGRMMMFNHLAERITLPNGEIVQIGGEERGHDQLTLYGTNYLAEFRLEMGLPVWRYEVGEVVLEKQIFLTHMQNSVYIVYRSLAGRDAVRLELEPAMHFRPHNAETSIPFTHDYTLSVMGDRYEVAVNPDYPVLRMALYGEKAAMTLTGGTKREVFYRAEADRGYESRGVLWTPGTFRVDLAPGQEATLVASTEPWYVISALRAREALNFEKVRRTRLLCMSQAEVHDDIGKELVLAADTFIMRPVGRIADGVRAQALGDDVRSVIAGYHWFTDWGRDTMISLEGLTLVTGRHNEAAWILRTFAQHIHDGLIPNLFPEGEQEGLYHTADATLWFFQALDRYLAYTNDYTTLEHILPKLKDIAEHHLRGTRFGIAVDPNDGLLRQGQQGYQLTWMDAKMGDWVVTPRRGKAVEINALWYNALRLMEKWLRELHRDGEANLYIEHAERARTSFNKRFWFEQGGYLYDVIDGENGNDTACRPNQIFAISLSYPVLDQRYWSPVIETVRSRLLTPVGLRSLTPGHPDYKPIYYGDLRARDGAYHQGTVWAWLIGPFIDAWLKLHADDKQGAREFLNGLVEHLGEACLGSISEVFDAEAPFTPRGCIAQAWSVAEVLRCWAKTD